MLSAHLDAVAVSPAEVGGHVASGKLKLLAVMADSRVRGFESILIFKERGIDLSLGAWRGLAAPKGHACRGHRNATRRDGKWLRPRLS